jgi:hypothetical protein
VLNNLAGRHDVIALNFAVTYWDHLGWKDSFAQPAFTQRQRDYVANGRGQVATTQWSSMVLSKQLHLVEWAPPNSPYPVRDNPGEQPIFAKNNRNCRPEV